MAQRTANSEQVTAPSSQRPYRLVFAVTCSLFAAVLTGCNSTPPATPLDQLNPQQARGHEVFETHCAQCHYDRSADPLHGPGLRGMMKKQYLPSGAPANDERVTSIIQHGRNLMPAQPFLDPQDTDDLLTYLHTL
jgi:mono/diheme cytochrome c family protein